MTEKTLWVCENCSEKIKKVPPTKKCPQCGVFCYSWNMVVDKKGYATKCKGIMYGYIVAAFIALISAVIFFGDSTSTMSSSSFNRIEGLMIWMLLSFFDLVFSPVFGRYAIFVGLLITMVVLSLLALKYYKKSKNLHNYQSHEV